MTTEREMHERRAAAAAELIAWAARVADPAPSIEVTVLVKPRRPRQLELPL
jgi:hypothetical protein